MTRPPSCRGVPDCRSRINEPGAPGARAADYVRVLNRDLLRLDAFGLDQLAYACRHHSNGLIEADITVQTCWDADRLDLGRIGVRPDPLRLCTPDARQQEVLERALRRSLR
jgi:uncharacterized protein